MKFLSLLIATSTLVIATSAAAQPAGKFSASSPDFTAGKPIDNKYVFNGFGCKGDNVSPAVQWKNPPAGTKSFAVLVHDPIAPTGGAGFWHWLVVDIPATATALPQGAGGKDATTLPVGAKQINTDFGAPGWGGPCPPPYGKQHLYNFTVYALKVDKLELPPNATASLTGFMVNMNSLGKASFSSRYGRKQ